jgi:hypothetical protein
MDVFGRPLIGNVWLQHQRRVRAHGDGRKREKIRKTESHLSKEDGNLGGGLRFGEDSYESLSEK